MQTLETRSDSRPRLSQDGAGQYLASLQRLARELDGAMKAIVQRELPSLQEILRCQQTTCAELVHFRSRDGFVQDVQPGTGSIDADLAEQIQKATDALVLLNKQYSSLLKHSGNTLRLLAGFFRSYYGPEQAFSDLQQKWSCEG